MSTFEYLDETVRDSAVPVDGLPDSDYHRIPQESVIIPENYTSQNHSVSPEQKQTNKLLNKTIISRFRQYVEKRQHNRKIYM